MTNPTAVLPLTRSVAPSLRHSRAHPCSSCSSGEVFPSQIRVCTAFLRRLKHVSMHRQLSTCTRTNTVRRLQVKGRQAEPSTIRSVPVQVAHELIKAGHHYLDVRTPEEFAGSHVEGSLNIPYLVKTGPGMSKNLKFVEEVSRQFDKDDEIHLNLFLEFMT